jgi:hypothetical protein
MTARPNVPNVGAHGMGVHISNMTLWVHSTQFCATAQPTRHTISGIEPGALGCSLLWEMAEVPLAMG